MESGFLVLDSGVIEIVRCPYCKLWVPTQVDGGKVYACFDSHAEIKYCTAREARLASCPICQHNSNDPAPKPREEHGSWYDPKRRFYGYVGKDKERT